MSGDVLAVAHRGDPIGHPENTLVGIEAAFRAGAPMVEIDVRLTSDGAPMLLHDADLTRLWNRPETFASLTRHEVRTLVDPAGQRLPDLAEAAELAVRYDGQLMVDLPEAQAGPVAHDVLAKAGELDRMLFAGHCVPLRSHAPGARIALSWAERAEPTEDLLGWLRPEYFNPYFLLLTPEMLERMHARGMLVSVWTVDDEDAMRAVLDLGADAVISNQIALLLSVIAGATSDAAPAVGLIR
ncbi:glycerophosphodiester phosphodiesterase [Nakamurella sp. A5-74]|uniref:Glycerophosphodiester phosphodiesterase n=1 Tax=Nakamurella sp. A5-74 TaxID=3158264 RepID=A0AAU8DQL5_9ACTN